MTAAPSVTELSPAEYAAVRQQEKQQLMAAAEHRLAVERRKLVAEHLRLAAERGQRLERSAR